MPYLYLAESYNELGLLADLVKEIENIKSPLKEFDEESYLTTEFQRIKVSALRDVLVFGTHADKYLNFHLCLVYGLTIRVIDLLRSLRDSFYLCDREMYLFKHCTRLHEEFGKLIVFYELLGIKMVRLENR